MRQLKTFALLISFSLPLAGCAYNLIAPYDATLDSTMTQVQHDTELFFNQLQEGHDGSYEASKDFYVRTEATLRTLLTRAQAVPKSHLVADQIARIESTLERDQGMHKRDTVLSLKTSQVTGTRWKASSAPFSDWNWLSRPISAVRPALPWLHRSRVNRQHQEDRDEL